MTPLALVERTVARSLHRIPRRLARRALRGRSPRDGFELDPTTALLLTLAARLSPPFAHTLPLARARESFDASIPLVDVPKDRSVTAEDGELAKLRVRTYRPRGLPRRAPGVVFFHGGGFAFGDLDSHDGLCRLLATELRAVVVAVHYRRAPEHRFPAATEDAFEAFQGVHASPERFGVDPARLAVAGDSAGGNLSAVTCLLSRDRGAALPAAQGLLYPAVDLRRTSASHRTFARGYLLEKDTLDWFTASYTTPERHTDPAASPLLAESHAGLPPAVLVTAGFDPLRDEGREYAARLEAAGVPVRYRCEGGLIHGFANMGGAVPAALAATRAFARDLRELLGAA